MQEYPMKRFPDQTDEWWGIHSDEAKDYGFGAFCWHEDEGVLSIEFRHPHKLREDDGDNTGLFSRIPVTGERAWNWNGDRDKPTLTPSILQRAYWKGSEELQEVWHGFITNGVLQVL